jgi:GNAT superfamily N-acetyltransferase
VPVKVRRKFVLGSIKRGYEVVEIDRETSKRLIDTYHYLGKKRFRSGKSYGLQRIVDKEFVGVAVFQSPSAWEIMVGAFGLEKKKHEGFWELGRFVLAPEYNGQNFGSFLLGQAIRKLRRDVLCRAIITYADSSLHYGALYQATNFIYCGLTAPKNDFWRKTEEGYVKQERGKTKGVDGEWRPRPRKHRYILVYDPSLQLHWEPQSYVKHK